MQLQPLGQHHVAERVAFRFLLPRGDMGTVPDGVSQVLEPGKGGGFDGGFVDNGHDESTFQCCYLKGGIADGSPTRMKNRANACEKCSTNGDCSRLRDPTCSAWLVRYSNGRL